MNKNRIEGDADQGERAMNREALVIKGNPLAPHAELARTSSRVGHRQDKHVMPF